jgi:Holliday junction resolvase
MNTKQKGTKVEKDIQAVLEAQGFVTMRSPRTMKPIGNGRYISQDCDYFNLFDIVAKKAGWTRWIQAKSTQSGVSSVKKDIAEFHNRHMASNNETSEIWLKVPRKGYVIYTVGSPYYGFQNFEKNFVDLKGVECDPFKIFRKEVKK